jgi:flagellar hook-associated protein 2
VQFIAGTDQTNASSTPYTVNITQAATQASVAATNPLGTSTQIDSSNDTLTLSLDGQNTTLTLANGDYTQTALAQMLQSAINSDTDLAGRQISVSVQGRTLTFTSASFGSSSQISFGSGSANAALGLTGTETSKGVDVAGNFVVNGVTEPAQGIGQFLPQTGRLTTIQNGLTTELSNLTAQQTQLTNAMNAKQQALETEFANMESTLAQRIQAARHEN